MEANDTIVTSHGISAFGDLKYAADFEHFDYVNPDAPRGGAISTWGFGTFDSLNPYIVQGNPLYRLDLVFESLMAQSHDEPDSYYGLIAESITYPEPGRGWAIFDIRPEAKFSDGSPVTADDVVASFELLSTHGNPQLQIAYQAIVKAEALDTHRVKFTFDETAATRDLPLQAAAMPIFAKSGVADRNFAESSLEPIVTSAPYIVEEADAGHFAVFRRRYDYWGDHLAVNKGHNNFDTVKIVYYADYTASFEGFKGGDYDFRQEYYSKLWSTGYDFPEIQSGMVTKEVIPDGEPSGAQGYYFNLRRPVFSDIRVRQAIGLAFNYEWSNQTLFHGAYARTDSFWENSNIQANGMPSADELALLQPLRGQIPETVFTEPAFTPAVSDAAKLADRGNLRKANALLDEAGWQLVDGKRQNADGEQLTFEFLSQGPSADRIINPYVENLKGLGIDANVRSPDAAQRRLLVQEFDFDVATRRYSFSLTPGTELRSAFGSVSAAATGSPNIAGVANSGVDALLDAVEAATTRDELNTAISALDRVLRAMHIWVPQWYSGTHRVAYRNVFSRPENKAPYHLGELTQWWYDKDKAARHDLSE